ncbi:MAG: DUF362 domain-containing protein [Armatimonadetes bacterium]|nr:DUF362 domain-containing protein [Armatimonadota bacterium]
MRGIQEELRLVEGKRPAQYGPPENLRGVVAAVRTSPETVLDDIRRVMELAGFPAALDRAAATILKINISWHFYMPACSTTPWQFDGVVQALRDVGWTPEDIIPAQNSTVVVNPRSGSVRNHLIKPARRHGLEFVWLFEKDKVEWVRYRPAAEMLVLERIYGEDNICIPAVLIGKNAIHLPTVKTHVFTTTTGAMKNAFGGLLDLNRHWTHANIHETLVDLLKIQYEIHPGLMAVMDGTIAGSGPGPRCMVPHVKNVLLASADQVAIDAFAAKIMGFDPMRLGFIRLAHEHGLGVGDPREIRVVGDEDIAEYDWGFTVGDTFASRGQKAIYWGPLKPLEHCLLRTCMVPWSYAASRLYHDLFWYPLIGYWRARRILKTTAWGALFRQYGR